MQSLKAVYQEVILRVRSSQIDVDRIIEEEILDPRPGGIRNDTLPLASIDPLDREKLVRKGLADVSSSLELRYVQVCRDLRDSQRLTWTGDAHELRDILSNVLRTLAPDDDVRQQAWYQQQVGTGGPTQAQRARYILQLTRSAEDSRQGADQLQLIDELVSKITRATYTTGSTLAHTEATRNDCILLLFYVEALLVSLLNAFNPS